MPTILDYRTFSERGYLAPTVYLKAGQALPRWNYYISLTDAVNKLLFLTNRGSINPTPIGSVEFQQSGNAQTLGINVDFFILYSGKWIPASYSYFKGLTTWPDTVFRFYTTQGNGPYYAVLNGTHFGLSATTVDGVSAEKIAALDSFHREVALLKYRYNAMAAFLTELSKRQLNATEQQIFNEGSLVLNNLRYEINGIEGIEVFFNPTGTIGVIPILLIAIIAILAGATAWTVSAIVAEREKTARINSSYELSKWISEKKTEVAAMAADGQISQASANEIYATLDGTAALANKVAVNASKPGGTIFGDIGNIMKWGLYGLAGYFIYTTLIKKKNA